MIKRGVGKVYGLGLVGWVSTSSGSFCNEGAVKAEIASPPPLSTLLPRRKWIFHMHQAPPKRDLDHGDFGSPGNLTFSISPLEAIKSFF